MVNKKKVVIVNKYGILFFVALIFNNEGIAQIQNYYLRPTQSLKIIPNSNNKIGVFIFQRKGDTSIIVSDLNESLNNVAIDYQNFDIHRIYTSSLEACSKDSLYLVLDGVEFLPHPYFEHYLILINSNNSRYKQIFYERLSNSNPEIITKDFKNIDYKVTFKKFESANHLIKLISLPIDTTSYLAKNEFVIYKRIADQQYKQNKYYVDSILNSQHYKGLKENYISVLFLPSITNNLNFKRLQQSSTRIEKLDYYNFQLCNHRFNIFQNSSLGYGMALSYSKIDGIIRNNLGYNPLIDTIDRNAFNSRSDRFILVGSANNIIEKFEFSSFGFSFLGSLRRKVKIKNVGSQIILNGGIKYSHIIIGTYSAISGSIRYDSLFYNNGTNNYRMGNTETLYTGKNNFKLNNRFYSGIVNISLVSNIPKLKNVNFSLGVYGEFGNNIITLPQEKEKKLSDSNQKYNSLFYRGDFFRINSVGAQFGILLKL